MKKFILFIAITVIVTSCATRTKVEYRDRVVDHYITNIVHDTLIDKTTDSVYVNVYTKGDTVFSERYKEKIRWRDRIVVKHDTCWRDSTTIIRKETTKEITKIPKLFKISFVISTLVIIFAFVKFIRYIKGL